jgi:hypothetical protein
MLPDRLTLQLAGWRINQRKSPRRGRAAYLCAGYGEIMAVDICLRKPPVLAGTGALGVRLILGAEELEAVRRPSE